MDTVLFIFAAACMFGAIFALVARKNPVAVGGFLGAMIICLSLALLRVERIEYSLDGGIKLHTRGPRIRAVRVPISQIAKFIDSNHVRVFLVPNDYEAKRQTNGTSLEYLAEGIPEGNYQILMVDSQSNKDFLLHPVQVSSQTNLPAIPRFPEHGALKGVLSRVDGGGQSTIPVVIPGESIGLSNNSGHFQIKSVPFGSHILHIESQDKSWGTVDQQFELREFEHDIGKIYFPDPVAEASFSREIHKIEVPGGRDEWSFVDQSDQFERGTPEVHFYTRIVGAQEDTIIYHKWYHRGRMLFERKLKINSNDYRTNSKSEIEGRTGEWKVEVLGVDKTLLKTYTFLVV